MKRIFLALSLIILSLPMLAQGVAINNTGALPDPSAMLDVNSNDKGVLLSRMTTAERNAIANPAQALMIYNTTTNCFEFFAYGVWQTMFCATCYTPTAASASASPNPICTGSTLNLTGNATGATIWSWTGPNGFTSTLQNPAISGISVAGSGIYTLTASNSCGSTTAATTASVIVNAGVPSAPTAATHTSLAAAIAWQWNAVSGAAGYKWSTTNNYSSATDNGTSTTILQTGLTCNTAYTSYVWAYNACGYSLVTTLTQISAACTTPCTWNGSNQFTVNHTAGAIAPVTKTVVYGQTQTAITGSSKCWLTQNLGSTNQATSTNDNTESAAGWYWQFNRKQAYEHDGVTRTPNTTWINPISETSNWLAANDPCTLELGAGWRIPTLSEWTAADGSPQNWSNYTGPYASVLKLHCGGLLGNGSGSLGARGSVGYFWSSNQYDSTDGTLLYFHSTACYTYNFVKTFGFTVRCLKD